MRNSTWVYRIHDTLYTNSISTCCMLDALLYSPMVDEDGEVCDSSTCCGIACSYSDFCCPQVIEAMR